MQCTFFDGAKRFKIDKPVRLIELFGGIGSQASALEKLKVDFEHYRLVEFDKYAIKSYNAIHGTNFETKDITQTTAEDLKIVETDKYCYIMTYSFPCQDLSKAGKTKGMAKGSGTRSGLLWEVERILTECKELPQVLLMENVTEIYNQYLEVAEGETGIQKQMILLPAQIIKQTIDKAREAQASGDIMQMIPALQDLQEITD